ncbi:uncharacterized protein DFL_003558 [Arthrobotrys flagrans]|uniref:Uncharacterized protein n=1 Tax=Arthrobotrys flagrans TaxID=97331 RepID=A0A437A277_ARTFL|nr:hypothetical protein DFL_003558 [Arthrobotrys flagrans]
MGVILLAWDTNLQLVRQHAHAANINTRLSCHVPSRSVLSPLIISRILLMSESSLGLQLLEPSPLTTPEASMRANPLSQTGSSEGTHRITHYLVRTQQISSYVFTGFLGIHWFTTGILPLVSNPEAVDNSLLLSRVLYQNKLIEPCIVLGSVGAHVLSGVALRAIRRAKLYKNYGQLIWLKDLNILQGTGYLLIPTVAIHFGIVRLLPFLKDGGSETGSSTPLSWRSVHFTLPKDGLDGEVIQNVGKVGRRVLLLLSLAFGLRAL